jgi:tRNA threonylcarbamoyladenosine biosynthesis protein TsaE
MSVVTHHCLDAEAQQAFGERLAVLCPAGCTIHLLGELGAGKTTLVRGFLRGMGHAGPVRSPTYTLVEPYELPGRTVYHLDLYRLGDPEELEYLGLRDLLGGDAILLIEWPERGAGWLPAPDLEIVIAHCPEGRDIRIVGHSAAGERICHDLSQVLS